MIILDAPIINQTKGWSFWCVFNLQSGSRKCNIPTEYYGFK